MEWINRSFDQYSILWLLLASTIGGLVGAGIKFLFEDIFRPRVSSRRESKRLVSLYTTPLMRSAEQLERQINNFARNVEKGWYENDEYYRLSTLYSFGDYLAWIKVVERDFGFVPYEVTKRGMEFNRHLYGLFRALTSFYYFKGDEDTAGVEDSSLPRHMLRAVGEAMSADVSGHHTKEFTQFLHAYANDVHFRRWFQELDTFLMEAGHDEGHRLDRLIAAGANLKAFIVYLDPKGRFGGRRSISNMDRITSAALGEKLRAEFKDLMPDS